jgi:hypothetical protein
LPRAAPGEPALPDGFRYRFRIVPRDQPIRTEVVGPFEISTVAVGFMQQMTADSKRTTWVADAHFLIALSGQRVAFGNGRVDAVAVVGGAAPALLIQVADETGFVPAACSFLSMQEDQPLIAPIGACDGRIHASPLTSDNRLFAEARDRVVPPGRVDRRSFATAGQYLLGDKVIDTRTLTTRAVSTADQSRQIGRIPPLGVSPDGASFIRLEFAEESDEAHALAVIGPATNERYRLPIDKARMRYATFDQIDPAWVLHHFTWQRDDAGSDRLVERQSFLPLAWRGTLTSDGSGYREYRVAPVQETLRTALIDFLAEEFQAERLPVEAGAYAHAVRIQGATVWVSYEARERHVGVWMDRGTDSTLVATIASRFDAELATGRYDLLFKQ